MFSIIKNYVMKYAVVTLLTIIAILSYLNHSLRNDNEDLIVRLGVEQTARIASQKQLEDSLQKQTDYSAKYNILREGNRELTIDLQNQNKLLESYKRRERIAIKKPKLVERLANRATVRLFNEYACTTGNSSACPDSSD